MDFKTLLFSFVVAFHAGFAQSQEEWKLIKNVEDIEIFTRSTPGSKIKSVKIITRFSCTLPDFLRSMLEVKAHHEWISNCSGSELLTISGDTSMVYHSHYNFPWPASNRDVIVHASIFYDKVSHTARVIHNGMYDYLPLDDKLVRIQEFQGRWKLEEVSGNKVFGEYVVHVDPGGNIPAWFVNLFLGYGPFETIRNLKERVRAY